MSRRAHDPGKSPGSERASLRRWEYLEVDVHVETWSDSTGRSGRLPISEAGLGQLPSVLAVLDELGDQGWGLQSLVKFADYDPQIQALYNDMFAQKIAVSDYGRQANQLLTQAIEESQKILKITGSKQ